MTPQGVVAVNVRISLLNRQVYFHTLDGAVPAKVSKIWSGDLGLPLVNLNVLDLKVAETIPTKKLVPHSSSVAGADEGYWTFTQHGDEAPISGS